MPFLSFETLADWKDFERLCADLLSSEGFFIESESFVDRTGGDIVAVEEYRSHDPGRTIRVRWRVQCKHYAGSGKKLGRKEVEESLVSYQAIRKPKEVIEKYTNAHPDARVTLWNQRQLMARLERHTHLLLRYGLSIPQSDYVSVLSPLKQLAPVRTLIISDQSVMAHNLTSALRTAGFDVTFLPFWNYQEYTRMELTRKTVLAYPFRLVICFLGDSFGLPLPDTLLTIVKRCYKEGAALLLFPFVAWSMSRGLYDSLGEIVPVRLQQPTSYSQEIALERIIGDYRRGDFRWILDFDSFAEDQYIELDPIEGQPPFTNEIISRFGLSHSFEYLTVVNGAKIVWADTTGNPMVIVKESKKSKVCYLNMCCHSCMTPIAVSSPLEATVHASILVRNIIEWLLQ